MPDLLKMMGMQRMCAEDEIRRLYDGIADRYDGAFADARSRAEDRLLIREMRGQIPPGPILDLGCGTGFALDCWPLAPWMYTGIDLSPRMLARAKRKHPAHTFLEGDMHDLSMLLSSRYALVLCLFGVLNHSREQSRALAEICRVLRPGGLLALLVAGVSWPQMQSSLPAHDEARKTMHFQSARMTDLLLRRNGFTLITRTSFHGPFFEMLPPLSPMIGELALQIEAATLGRIAPDACGSHLFTARKGGRYASATARIQRV